MERDMNNILLLSTDFYDNKEFVRIKYTLNHAQLEESDQFWIERIIADKNTPTAMHLLSSEQPVYFWQSFPEDGDLNERLIQDAVFISEHTYLQSYEYEDEDETKKYDQEWVNVTYQVKGATQALYDLDVPNISDRVYGYRLHYFTFDENGIVTSHLATQFAALINFMTEAESITVMKSQIKTCITSRNLAYRGKNSLEKYNFTLKEIESDFMILETRLVLIEPGEFQLDTSSINMIKSVDDEYNKLYAVMDKIEMLKTEDTEVEDPIQLYTITFDSQGADVQPDPISLNIPISGIIYELPTEPTKNNEVFDGWYTEPFGVGDEITVDTIPTDSMTVYAKWIIQYNVTFDSQSATTDADPTSVIILDNELLILPTPPEKDGHTFTGWFTEVDGAGTELTAATPITADITAYAYWVIISYTVSFDDQSATTAVDPLSLIIDYNNSADALPTEPLKTGYAFNGWFTEINGAGTVFTVDTIVTADIIIYAEWIEVLYAVTYDDQGATVAVDPDNDSVLEDHSVDALPTPPEKDGNRFDGWFTVIDGGGTEFTADTLVTDDITLYALWTIVYTVTYDGNTSDGGTVPVDNNKYPNGTNVDVLDEGTLTKTDYYFIHWNTAADGSGTSYTHLQVLPITENTILYALWTNILHTVTFDENGGDTAADPTSMDIPDDGTAMVLPTNPTKADYNFIEWNTLADGSGTTFDEDTIVNGSITVYAKWEFQIVQ